MNFRSLMRSRLFWLSIWITLFLFSVVGCKVEDKTWIDKMLSEMELAWIQADEAGLGQERREKAVNLIVQRYFRSGMPKAEAFGLLSELEKHGFEIGEYRHEGARKWPDGELKPYLDAATKKNMQRQILHGFSRITASKRYGRTSLMILKHAGITITVADHEDSIINVDGALGLTSL